VVEKSRFQAFGYYLIPATARCDGGLRYLPPVLLFASSPRDERGKT